MDLAFTSRKAEKQEKKNGEEKKARKQTD